MSNNYKKEACEFFETSNKQIKAFDITDPLNPKQQISGFICKKDGPFGGSLCITHVNNQKLDKLQKIYGVPKLLYPYSDKKKKRHDDDDEEKEEGADSEELQLSGLKYKESFKTDDKVTNFVLSNKWNGTNVLFFKYYDKNGTLFVSAKTKGSPTLTDTQYGDFYALTLEALYGSSSDKKSIDVKNPPAILKEFITRPEIQSLSCELCGKKEPHLVLYDFDIDLKPLFMQHVNGGFIEPVMNTESNQQYEFTGFETMTEICKSRQVADFNKNEEYRKSNNLEVRYEYNHFITEGAVLYICCKPSTIDPSIKNKENWPGVSNRRLYKIKPKDIEEVHWSVFGDKQKELVNIAIKKLLQREKDFSKESLIEELDIGPKEFSRFQHDLMQYARVQYNAMAKTTKPSSSTSKSKNKKKK